MEVEKEGPIMSNDKKPKKKKISFNNWNKIN